MVDLVEVAKGACETLVEEEEGLHAQESPSFSSSLCRGLKES